VREHRDTAALIVRGLGGRLVKTMGDGVLLEFPSVVAAVECAIAMRSRWSSGTEIFPRHILCRIGVNIGEVLIDGADILGDGVNIAARLEGIAEHGGVCISDDACRQVRGKIEAEFVDLGEKMLKNIARPVRAYSLAPSPRGSPPAPPPEKSGPPRLSIVVLPLANLGGDPERDYFVDRGISGANTRAVLVVFVLSSPGEKSSSADRLDPLVIETQGRLPYERHSLDGRRNALGRATAGDGLVRGHGWLHHDFRTARRGRHVRADPADLRVDGRRGEGAGRLGQGFHR
jgi:hypothetical protein